MKKLHKSLFINGILLFFSILLCKAEYRELTNLKGQKLVAKVVSMTEEKVTLEREDGKTFVLKKALFSAADNEYFNRWKTLDPFHKDNFSLSATLEHSEISSMEMGIKKSYLANKHENFWYAINLKNGNAEPLSNLRLEYAIYKKNKLIDYLSPTIVWKVENLTIPANSEKKALTDKLLIKRTAKERRKKDLKIHGIWVRVFHGDTMVNEFIAPKNTNYGKWPINWIPPKKTVTVSK